MTRHPHLVFAAVAGAWLLCWAGLVIYQAGHTDGYNQGFDAGVYLAEANPCIFTGGWCP